MPIVTRTVLAACLPALLACGQASAEDWTEFITDSHLQLLLNNQFFQRDYRDGPNNAGRNRFKPKTERNGYRQEWGQALQLHYQSGFTPGTLGLGVDAFAMQAFKLDSGGGRTGTGTLAIDGQGHPRDRHGKAGGSLKLRAANTRLRYGDFSTRAPVLAADNSRILPGVAHGLQFTAQWSALDLEAAHLTALSGPTESKRRGRISTVYAKPHRHGIDIGSASYLGFDSRTDMPWNLSYYLGRLEDAWTQHYLRLGHELELGPGRALGNEFSLYLTRDTGAARLGPLDNRIWSHALSYRHGVHRLTLAFQRSHADTPFDYIGFGDGQTGQSIFLANAAAYSDFNGPHERSWQLRYDQKLAWLGLPELNASIRHQRGWGVDGSRAPTDGLYHGLYGRDGRHHEWDLDLRYTLPAGPLKNLQLRATQIWHRGNRAQADGSIDQVRLRLIYPLDIL